MTDTTDIGIVCPDCGGNLNAKKKTRKGTMIEHRYDCMNAACPALLSGKRVSVLTEERKKRVFYRPLNSTRRRKRKNLPASEQKTLPLADSEPKIDNGMERP